MRKELITCDHCGAELDDMYDYVDLDLAEFDFEPNATADLCKCCYKELSSKIAEFCNRRTSDE